MNTVLKRNIRGLKTRVTSFHASLKGQHLTPTEIQACKLTLEAVQSLEWAMRWLTQLDADNHQLLTALRSTTRELQRKEDA